jgi:three-Cys-motif partner protein
MNNETECPGCDGREVHTTDDCCDLHLDADELPARCVGSWSEDKLFYLNRYCDIFTTGMKNIWRNRIFIDLFCGPGRCIVRPQGDFGDGSPLVALRHTFTHYFFVDISSHCIQALQKRTSGTAAMPGKVMKIITGDANNCIEDLVRQVEALGPQTIGFAFVDPPGIQFDFETLRRLSKCTRMDLLINFPLGMNIKRQLKHQLQKGPEDEVNFDRYFGTNQWRDLCDVGPSMRVIGQRLLQLYEEQLRSLGYAYVGDEHAVKNRGVSLYMLVFASKDPCGKKFWENVTKIEPSGQRKLL